MASSKLFDVLNAAADQSASLLFVCPLAAEKHAHTSTLASSGRPRWWCLCLKFTGSIMKHSNGSKTKVLDSTAVYSSTCILDIWRNTGSASTVSSAGSVRWYEYISYLTFKALRVVSMRYKWCQSLRYRVSQVRQDPRSK